MADVIVSTVLQHLTTIVATQVEQEVRLVVGVDDEVQKMTSNFQAIQAVIADAEQKQFKEATIQDWVDKLKDVSYEIDDVLDEWTTAIMKLKMEEDQTSSSPKRKVCSFIPSPCFCCKRVVLRRDIGHKIKELNERLDVIAKEKDRFHFNLLMNSNELPERQMTAPVIDVSEVEGREQDKKAIMNNLLSESSQGPLIPIISIVGMGGLGKTTLAKLVYNDDEMMTHFDKRIWVCVSDPFDDIRVAKAILETLMDSTPNLVELPALVEHIQRQIRGIKFLLVLDDLWTEDSRKWEQLRNSLMCGSPGSKILVTTRKENVAISMGCRSIDMFRLGLLSTEQCWSLLSRIAFYGRSSGEHKALESIGRKIANKCKGLPLAAKTLGSLLRFRTSKEGWQSVLDSDLWELEEAKRDLLAPLWLSYYDLSPKIKRCFSYCAIFPKDYKLEKNELISLWLAQGYLKGTENRESKIIGNEYFNNLAARSFFQEFENDDYGNIVKCKMHDMVHDFAQFLTKGECVSIVANDHEEGSVSSLCRNTRHLLVECASLTSFPVSLDTSMKLRSLLVVRGQQSWLEASKLNSFKQVPCLRSLKLTGYSIEKIAGDVGELIHLRHLDLSLTSLTELPERICGLYNLQTLVLKECNRLEKLPYNMGKLLNLRHLKNNRTATLTFMPQGMEKLTSLKTLEEFVVNGGGHEVEACTLGSLYNFNQLQILGIRGLGNVTDVTEAEKAQLKSKKNLIALRLVLNYHGTETEGRIVTDNEVIEALEPPPCLEFLRIVSYKGIILFPRWMMSLNNLKSVALNNFKNCEHFPPLGKLPFLEALVISWWQSVRKVGQEFLGIDMDVIEEKDKKEIPTSSSSSSTVAFPKLQRLALSHMDEWKQWDGEIIGGNGDEYMTSSVTIMPCLQSFTIFGCVELRELPDWLLQKELKELMIKFCPYLSSLYHPLEGTHGHKVSHINRIHIDKPSENKESRAIRLAEEMALQFESMYERVVQF